MNEKPERMQRIFKAKQAYHIKAANAPFAEKIKILVKLQKLYASVNSFTQTVARVRQREEVLKRWPPRAGDQALL